LAEIQRHKKQSENLAFDKLLVIPFHDFAVPRRGIKPRAAYLVLIVHNIDILPPILKIKNAEIRSLQFFG